jgi:hypothetical protein
VVIPENGIFSNFSGPWPSGQGTYRKPDIRSDRAEGPVWQLTGHFRQADLIGTYLPRLCEMQASRFVHPDIGTRRGAVRESLKSSRSAEKTTRSFRGLCLLSLWTGAPCPPHLPRRAARRAVGLAGGRTLAENGLIQGFHSTCNESEHRRGQINYPLTASAQTAESHHSRNTNFLRSINPHRRMEILLRPSTIRSLNLQRAAWADFCSSICRIPSRSNTSSPVSPSDLRALAPFKLQRTFLIT